MMDITDFEVPTQHPYGMLEGFHLEHTYQCESLLAWMLTQCIEAGDLAHSVKLRMRHPGMVRDGLLEEDGEGYRLTKKSIGFLWAYYGKESAA